MNHIVTQIQHLVSPRPKRSLTWSHNPLLGPGECASSLFLEDGYTDSHGNFLPFAMRQTLYKDHEFHSAGHALEGPPLHRHIDETEHFTVEKGQIVFFADPDIKKPLPVESQSATTVIQPMVAHRFTVGKDTSEDLTVVIASKGGRKSGIDQRFFRNLYSYQADCIAQGLEPSKLQYLVFFQASNTLLADPPILVARALNLVGSWIGWLLGYRASYPEYYRPKSESSKTR